MSANTILTSVVTGGSNSHATVAEEINAYATDFVTQGVVGTFGLNAGSGGTGSFAVNADASPDMGITIKAGQAYVSATPSSQGAQVLRARASSDYTAYTINANASGSTKYDWIYLSVSAVNANTPSASADNVTSIYISRSTSNSTDNGSAPTYGLLLAVVTVANGASSITNSNISDRRVQASVSTAGTSNTTGWVTGLATPNTVAYNGNHSYTCTINGTDLTGTISKGMRLMFTRLVAAPTQSTSLNGSTQYYSKASPTGMGATDNITASAWIKLTSYASAGICSRSNGTTDGWNFYINGSGQLIMNGARAADDSVTSYQSVPLNKWVHVAASINSAGTAGAIYIDGVLVPSLYTNNANSGFAAPTQSFLVGAIQANSPTFFFPGKIAQVAVYNAVISAATILASISQTLSGSETSLISAYSFNGVITDLNANANNLTANGSAVATATDSPFAQGATAGTLEYGIVTSATFSTNTTLTVQVPEGCAIPTSGGVSAVSYSSVAVPYGFPKQTAKWRVESLFLADTTQASPTNGTWYDLFARLTFPIGEWMEGYEGSAFANNTTNQPNATFTLSSSSSASSDARFNQRISLGSTNNNIVQTISRRQPVSETTATLRYFLGKPNTAAHNTVGVRSSTDESTFVIFGELSYL